MQNINNIENSNNQASSNNNNLNTNQSGSIIDTNNTNNDSTNNSNNDIDNKDILSDLIPENFSDYILEKDDRIPKNELVDTEFKQLAHSLKLNHKQVKTLSGWANKVATESIETHYKSINTAKEVALNQLKSDWGSMHEQNIEKSIRTANRLSALSPEFAEFIEETGAGNNPKFIKTIFRIGELISEDKLNLSSSKSYTDKSAYLGNIPLLSFGSMKD